jgi:hypothetical protein
LICAPEIDTYVVVDVNTTVNFNTPIPTLVGDMDFLPFFSWSKPDLLDPSTWMAKFNLPYNVELDILDGTVLTTSWVGGGTNRIRSYGGSVDVNGPVLATGVTNGHNYLMPLVITPGGIVNPPNEIAPLGDRIYDSLARRFDTLADLPHGITPWIWLPF